MSALVYFIFWAGLLFLIMRFGCGAHVMGRGHGANRKSDGPGDAGPIQWPPPETAIDPVCRVSVRTDSARSTVYGGAVYYFCSGEHRDAFEAEPQRYAGFGNVASSPAMEHQHG